MTQYNKTEIMRNANAYAKIMSRSEALRKAWKGAKAQENAQALYITPDQFQHGDRVAIQVAVLDGKVCWYPFEQITRECSDAEVVASFHRGTEWPPINFVLGKSKRFVVERRVAGSMEMDAAA